MQVIPMKMRALLVLSLFAVSVAAAQNQNPVSSVVKEILPRQEKNIVAALDSMPADKFDYKPTPEQMTFGHLATHIAEANYTLCALAGDVPAPKPVEVKDTAGKDKLVTYVKESFDFCTKSLEKADDSKLGDTIEAFGGRKAPRAWAFIALASSWSDHYGAAAIYLRLNGILPPTAKPKK
jgi:hypothetical protein